MSPRSYVLAYLTNSKYLKLRQNQGDLWYFPAGIPHSLQATDSDPSGSEFLLVSASILLRKLTMIYVKIFDSGDFNEDSTFLVGMSISLVTINDVVKKLQLTDWLAHVPAEGRNTINHVNIY